MLNEWSRDTILRAYSLGIFPMARSRHSADIDWIEPRMRGVIPLTGFHVSRSLSRTLLKCDYDIRVNTAFEEVVIACADRSETWINETIFDMYRTLFASGDAQSLEVWRDGNLIGGVYGITLGGAFFGESMFSHQKDGSKIALAYLVHRLRNTGFGLFDTQFITPHLKTLGAEEIPQKTYLERLYAVIGNDADFRNPDYSPDVCAIAQRSTHTS